jgi:hypothetical protein
MGERSLKLSLKDVFFHFWDDGTWILQKERHKILEII